MKRIATVVIVLLLVIMNSSVYAERYVKRGVKQPTEVEVGLKSFFDTLKTETNTGSGGGSDNIAVIIGPAITVKFPNRLFIEADYLITASEYVHTESIAKRKLKRTDTDLSIGFMLRPEFGVHVGYMTSELKSKLEALGVSIDIGKSTNSGAYAGILGFSSAEKNEVAFYYKLDYLLTKLKTEVATISSSEDNPGWRVEIGFRDHSADGTIVYNFGYRVETTESKESKLKNTFSGVSFGVAHTF